MEKPTMPLDERDQAILRLVNRALDLLEERKPMGIAPEPNPAVSQRIYVVRQSA